MLAKSPETWVTLQLIHRPLFKTYLLLYSLSTNFSQLTIAGSLLPIIFWGDTNAHNFPIRDFIFFLQPLQETGKSSACFINFQPGSMWPLRNFLIAQTKKSLCNVFKIFCDMHNTLSALAYLQCPELTSSKKVQETVTLKQNKKIYRRFGCSNLQIQINWICKTRSKEEIDMLRENNINTVTKKLV